MKDFAEFLKDTHYKRKNMIDLATKKINESILSSENAPKSSIDARLSLSIFRSEMEIYHNWLMDQLAHADHAQKKS